MPLRAVFSDTQYQVTSQRISDIWHWHNLFKSCLLLLDCKFFIMRMCDRKIIAFMLSVKVHFCSFLFTVL